VVLYAVFCLSLNGRERETNRSGWSHVAGSRNAYSYEIRGVNKRACLYLGSLFCSEYMVVRERDRLIAGHSRWFAQRLLVRDTWPIKASVPLLKVLFCSEYRVVRERDGSIAGRMSLVHATPARTGNVAYTSERAFTQGNECMNERGINRLPVCFSVRWIRRSHSFFFQTLIIFSNVCYSFFFSVSGKN
jgi:hypothetical protein